MNTKRTINNLATILFFALSTAAHSEQFQSSPFKTPLIELYTSEGCSSCPPADRWLSTFTNDEQLWQKFVPVAFHVDYWDYIGWKDEFAKPDFSERQRQYAREGGSTAIYTPGVRKAGQLWTGWRLPFARPELAQEQEKVGSLRFLVNEAAEFTASFDRSDSVAAGRDLTLNVAVLGLGLETQVKRGENRGKRLKHDFVVLDLIELNSVNDAWQGQLPTVTTRAPQYAVAVWVSAKNRQAPIQATGGLIGGWIGDTARAVAIND